MSKGLSSAKINGVKIKRSTVFKITERWTTFSPWPVDLPVDSVKYVNWSSRKEGGGRGHWSMSCKT